MQKLKFLLFLVLAFSPFACKSTDQSELSGDRQKKGVLTTQFLKIRDGFKVRVGVQSPDKPIVGDVLFLIGFADRIDNHGPLFAEWNKAGFRVVSFEYPSHGETTGPGLDKFNFPNGAFPGLAQIAKQVEIHTREDSKRPLVLAGWSTGGLVGVRLVQGLSGIRLERSASAAVFFAPAVAVRALVGKAGKVTQDTLTKNPKPPHGGPIKPISPLLFPLFAADMLVNVKLSGHENFPSNIPTLFIIGDEKEDHYVSPANIEKWVGEHRKSGNKNIAGLKCPGAMHELDNEPDPVGVLVRKAAASFAQKRSVDGIGPNSACKAF